jgi:hypothetical protein
VNQLIWRLHRNQVYFAAAALALLAVLLLITGINMAHDYHVALSNCAATQSCRNLGSDLFQGDGAILDVVNVTLVVPLLFGLFWGAPLVAKEIEDGTHNLVWTQAVTRRRWLGSNVMWALIAATVWGATMAALVSWWRIPENALDARFSSFDIQGVVPIAYSIFAVALGIAVGSIFRRVLPAIGTTLGLFVGIRVVIAEYVRPHYAKPVSHLYQLLNDKGGAPTGSWVISSSIVGPNGHSYGNSFSLNDIPAVCKTGSSLSEAGASLKCVASHGFHQLITYQPANRFWLFQGVEATFFVVLSVGLVALSFRRVLSRDA